MTVQSWSAYLGALETWTARCTALLEARDHEALEELRVEELRSEVGPLPEALAERAGRALLTLRLAAQALEDARNSTARDLRMHRHLSPTGPLLPVYLDRSC